SGLLVVGTEGVFPCIECHREVAAILHAGQLRLVAVDRRRQRAAHKLLVTINVNRGLRRIASGCCLRIRSGLLGNRGQAHKTENRQPQNAKLAHFSLRESLSMESGMVAAQSSLRFSSLLKRLRRCCLPLKLPGYGAHVRVERTLLSAAFDVDFDSVRCPILAVFFAGGPFSPTGTWYLRNPPLDKSPRVSARAQPILLV